MQAISYLLELRRPSARFWAGVLLLGTVLTWFNVQVASDAPNRWPALFDNLLVSLVWGALAVLAGLLGLTTVVAVWLAVPLLAAFAVSTTLSSWIRKRRVEEMICAGIAPSTLVDGLARSAALWWLSVSLPSVAAALWLLAAHSVEAGTLRALLFGWIVPGLLAIAAGLYGAVWGGSAGVPKTPFWTSLLLLLGLPALGFSMAGLTLSGLLVASLTTLVICRTTAVHVLGRTPRSGAGAKPRPRRVRRFGPTALPENAISARESMRGADRGDWLSRGLALALFLLTAALAERLQAVWLFVFLVAPAMLVIAYRAAGKMSRMVIDERETGGMEALRATPLPAAEFLHGGIHSAVRAGWLDTALLLLLVGAAVAVMDRLPTLGSDLVLNAVVLCALAPIIGCYLGAALAAGQRSRAEASGLLLTFFMGLTAVAGPLWMCSALLLSLPVSLAVLVTASAVFCRWLDGKARIGIDGVFSPQKS